MRPLLLKLKNIASLKGEHLIDFREVSSHGPLFAITGETGSGKSTLLNAMALALYGEVYKKNVNQVDLVTLGEKEGAIEFLFQLRGEHYLAEWRGKVRKQSGELLKQPQLQRHVYPIDGDKLSSLRRSPVESVEKLLNLNFDQFCKCVILNQGEFARFLSSSFSERKDILEKFYPGEELESLTRELRLQMDGLLQIKNNLEVELKSLQQDELDGPLLTAQRESTEQQLVSHQAWQSQLDKMDFHFSSMLAYHEKFLENEKRSSLIKQSLMEQTTSFNGILKDSDSLREKLQETKLKQHSELPRLQELLQKEESLKHQQNSALELQKRLAQLAQQLQQSQTRLKELATKEESWRSNQQELSKAFYLPLEHLIQQRQPLEQMLDTYYQLEKLQTELAVFQDKLSIAQTQGKQLALRQQEIEHKLSLLPPQLSEKLTELEQKKTEIQKLHEARQRAIFHHQELQASQRKLELARDELQQKCHLLVTSTTQLSAEMAPLETVIKMQQLMQATLTCVNHVQETSGNECPVCQSHWPEQHWQQLAQELRLTDVAPVKLKFETLTRSLLKNEETLKLARGELLLLEEQIQQQAMLLQQQQEIKAELPELNSIEAEVSATHKALWEYENGQKELTSNQLELIQARESWVRLKNEVDLKGEVVEQKAAQLATLTKKLDHIDHMPVSSELMARIQEDTRRLGQYLEHQASGDKLLQEKAFIASDEKRLQETQQALQQELQQQRLKATELEHLLQQELGGRQARQLIEELNQQVKLLEGQWSQQESLLKKKELELKEYQARLHTLEDLKKEIELHFQSELAKLHTTSSAVIAINSENQSILTEKFKAFELGIAEQTQLFTPLKDLLSHERHLIKDHCNELRMQFAALNARLQEWEKRQDRIRLLEMNLTGNQAQLHRMTQLAQVLGKDDLRTFVLSLVEENLIRYTNEELQKLCQGRYEIIHQGRGPRPEFYILDKFREGGQRKVSTLSGGETFMVSLAMALALAEMTRGQAEVDSLFIDEGFGTLDQDSLEDVLDMLNQIQNRGLMVGIISHIKSLTSALPVNLVLNKHNDGTSQVSIRLN
jgi:DNA repair protein SbcC/Rad50